jgi:hypothetical protein
MYTLRNYIVLLGFITILSLSTFGLMCPGMTAHLESQATTCPFMAVAAISSAWQSMFAALPFESMLSMILLLLAMIAVSSLAFSPFSPFSIVRYRHDGDIRRWMLLSPWYSRHLYFQQPILQEAFSNGILNPKPF